MKDNQLVETRLRKWKRAENDGDGKAAESLLLSGLAAIRVILNNKRANASGHDLIPESDCIALEFIVEGLEKFSCGESLESAFGLAKKTGRPRKGNVEKILDYALPVSKLVEEGRSEADAIKEVARKAGVSTRTVKRGWDLKCRPEDNKVKTQGFIEFIYVDKK